MSASRMQHYAAFLQSFYYEIRFRPTGQHYNADTFSHLPLKEKTLEYVIEQTDYLEINMIETVPLTIEELAKASAKDQSVKCSPNYTLHTSAQIEIVRNGNYCQSTRAEPTRAPTHCWETPTAPFERVHVDFAGPFMNTYFNVLVDTYTKWPEVRILNNITIATTIQICRENFASFGIPSALMGAPYHPATNGQVERFIQTFKAKLKSLQCDRSSIHAELCKILLAHQKTIHPAIGKSPSMMLFNRQIRFRLDLLIPNSATEVKKIDGKVRDIAEGARVAARDYPTRRNGNTVWFLKNSERCTKG
ncbi:uncharacterized protein K02A2.6-like [Uranotaenia lowii]|uniref:uncharacterized protein K02A2.6-like n=1 Tax=Uranotaenia lowii TaxID=190385 RepID=UPI0024785CF0|nr:uncharacterized protein K02A2.6-like [Uranotaenia lowii]